MSPQDRVALKRYNRVLQRAYQDCRIRWSERSECWMLERKANYARVDLNPEKYPREAVDTFTRMRDGYFLVGEYAPERIPDADRLVAFLRSQDPERLDLGSGDAVERAARLASAIEAREAEEHRRFRASQTFEGSGMGAELYDQLAWDEGRRAAVPGNYAFGSGPCVPLTAKDEPVVHE